MRRTPFILPAAVAFLAGLVPGNAVAGPPEGVSGRMAFDEVVDGLRKYQKEKDDDKRIRRLEALGPTRHPRVALAIGELCREGGELTGRARYVSLTSVLARLLLERHFVPPGCDVEDWWDANEAGLRRRARELPR